MRSIAPIRIRSAPDSVRGVLLYLAVTAVVVVSRWLFGLPAIPGRPRRTDATWLDGAVPARRTTWYRLNLRYWPGWQLAVVRCASVAVVVTAWLAPVVTAAVAGTVAVTVTAVVLFRRRHRWVIGPADRPIRVRARVGPPRRVTPSEEGDRS